MGACGSVQARKDAEDAWLFVEVPSDVAAKLHDSGEQAVSDDMLLPGGSVQNCLVRVPAAHMHITLLTGLRSSPALVHRVRHVVRQFVAANGQNTIPVQLGEMSTFCTPDVRKVVKVDVESPSLRELQGALQQMLGTPQTHSFEPHVTVAFCLPDAEPRTGTATVGKALAWATARIVLQQKSRREITNISLSSKKRSDAAFDVVA